MTIVILAPVVVFTYTSMSISHARLLNHKVNLFNSLRHYGWAGIYGLIEFRMKTNVI